MIDKLEVDKSYVIKVSFPQQLHGVQPTRDAIKRGEVVRVMTVRPSPGHVNLLLVNFYAKNGSYEVYRVDFDELNVFNAAESVLSK